MMNRMYRITKTIDNKINIARSFGLAITTPIIIKKTEIAVELTRMRRTVNTIQCRFKIMIIITILVQEIIAGAP